jgi:hypothetical protein
LVFTTQPGGGTGGTAWTQQPVVTIEDAGGNTVITDNTDQVTLAILNNAGSGTLTCTTNPVTVNAGVAAFVGCKIDKAGNGYTLKATSGTLTQANSNAFNITTGPAAKLLFTTQPGGGTGGTAWAQQPVVTVEDAGGNTVTTSSATVALAITSGTGTAGATLACTTNPLGASSGVVMFAGCKIDKTGNNYTLTATSNGLTSAVSANFNITVGTAAQLLFTTEPNGGASATAWTTQPIVTITDAGGNTVITSSASVALAITSGTGTAGATLTCTTNPLAASSGVATFAGCKIDKAGNNYTLTATSSGLTSAISTAFNITPGPPTQLAFIVQPSNVIAGAAISPAVQVAIEDAQGNTVTAAANPITIAIGANPGSGTLSGTLTVSAVSGVATFSTVSINSGGAGYTLTASAMNLHLTGATSNPFNVIDFLLALAAGTPNPLQVTAGTPANVQINVTTTPANSPLPAEVDFTCAVPASLTGAGCTVMPTKFTAGSQASQVNAMITSTAFAPPSPMRRDPWTPSVPWIPVTTLAGLAMLWLASKHRTAPLAGRTAYLLLALLLITGATLVGCTTAAKLSPTPKGPSTVTVTATSGSVVKKLVININVN